jgi:hypothetical protein
MTLMMGVMDLMVIVDWVELLVRCRYPPDFQHQPHQQPNEKYNNSTGNNTIALTKIIPDSSVSALSLPLFQIFYLIFKTKLENYLETLFLTTRPPQGSNHNSMSLFTIASTKINLDPSDSLYLSRYRTYFIKAVKAKLDEIEDLL